MGRLIKIQDIDQFFDVVNVPEAAITPEVLEGVRQLDERRELEPMLRQLLWDTADTPHGPTEIADILTSKVRLRGARSVAAFVVKGRSYQKVRARDVAHQVLRLREVPGMDLMVLVAVGDIQDDAQRDFLRVALDADCHYLIIDAADLARLLIAYELVCPKDGTPYGDEGVCAHGHQRAPGVEMRIQVRGGLEYEIAGLEDVSWAAARRLSARVLVNGNYDREALREIIRGATARVAESNYHRNRLVAEHWRGSRAQVVWLFLATDLQDLRNYNWVARSEWVDSRLDAAARPMALDADEYIDEIGVAWNESHEEMRAYYGGLTADKGDFLKKLEPLVERVCAIGGEICQAFDQFESGAMMEHDLEVTVRGVSAEVAAIVQAHGNLPFPPHDARDYDLRAESLVNWLDNMVLYYSDRGLETWPQENRTSLMRDSVRDFRSDLARLAFEREKLH